MVTKPKHGRKAEKFSIITGKNVNITACGLRNEKQYVEYSEENYQISIKHEHTST